MNKQTGKSANGVPPQGEKRKTHREAGASWADPFERMYRDGAGQLVPLTDEEYGRHDWYDVTSLDDPAGVHVFVKLPAQRDTR